MGDNKLLFSAVIASVLWAAMPLAGATFGNVVTTVGGHPADIALDESRGQLYIANFTALEIDVMSTKDNTIHTTISLPSHPSAVAISPDSTYLVVSEYQNGVSTPTARGLDGVTIINLNSNGQQSFSTGDPALGVVFLNTGQASGMALIATTTGFLLLDPISGQLQILTSFTNLALTLPVAQGMFPGQIVETQMTVSANGLWVWGIADGGTGTQLIFRFDVRHTSFTAQTWITAPPLLPRVSVAADGSWALIGWSLFAPDPCSGGFMVQARYPQAVASNSITGHAANASSGVTDTIYAQIFDPTQPAAPPYYSATSSGTASTPKYPTLSIMDSDNLTVRDRLYLPENLVGRALLDSAGKNMYAISDSGVTVLPVGSLNRYPRLAASQEDALVQTNFCSRNPLTATFKVTDPGNNATDFSISSPQTGVLVSPSSGKTPATVTVTVQSGAIPSAGGTLAVPLVINSATAVNVAPTVRLLISNPDQDQRGTIVDIPGQLTDLLPDVARNRFYVLRQDKNQVLVFDGSSYQQLATLRTGTTPTGMAFSNDGKYLQVASGDSQLLQVFDLDSLQAQSPIVLPGSHYGRSVAQSNAATLVLVENDTTGDCGGTSCAIDRVDFPSRCAYSPQALGIYKNDSSVLPSSTAISPSPDQNSILVAAASGTVMLYDAAHDTFILSRKDLTSLSGAYAASSSASASTSGPAFPTRYVIGDNVFDAALVPQGTLDTSIGHTSGFAFTGAGGYRVTGSTAAGAGVIQNVPNVLQGTAVKPVRTMEAPLLTSIARPFTRTVAPLSSGIALLTTSGVTMLAQNYDASVASPAISSVVNAADGTQSVAPGGLISVYGQQMSPVNLATSQIPLPTALGNSCLSVNGAPVPLLFVSGQQINAQLPFNVAGTATLTIHTPGGISNNYLFPVQAAAPSVFQTGTAGPLTGLATIVRADDNQLVTAANPIHPKDTVVIYLTGMGSTLPAVDAGMPAPSNPLAAAAIAPVVTLGGQPLSVLYAGLVPGEVGVYQINATVPGVVTQGMSIPLTINQGAATTTLNVRVVN
jgi:uncharacterized protein (TIGR03437 family)